MKTAEPVVNIINYTKDALSLLIYTKNGRLKLGTTFRQVKEMPYGEKLEHLSYMLDTIKSPFDFVDYVFEIKNVSRAFTHQLVRTRNASYQQQAMRVVDAREHSCLKTSDNPRYNLAIKESLSQYGFMIDEGVNVQDARGVLPTAIHTEIMAKISLRELSHMAEVRLCKRAEGEYQKVFKLMVKEVLKLHPWTEPLLKVYCVKTGLCQFPRYEKCPVQKYTYNWERDEPFLPPHNRRLHQIKKEWEHSNHIAAPKVLDGKGTM